MAELLGMAKVSAEAPKTEESTPIAKPTMEQMLAQKGVAGPNGAVFGRSNNTYNIPEMSLLKGTMTGSSMLNQNKDFLAVQSLFPDLAMLVKTEVEAKSQPKQSTQLPAEAPLNAEEKFYAEQKKETMKLLNTVKKITDSLDPKK
jgi:hypothetical protein